MGRIGKHLKAEIKDFIEQTIETRLNFKQTALTYAPSGDDSPPLKNDRIILVSIDGSGKFAAVGVLTVSQGAKPGEKILYSRDENGEVKAILSLLNDGKVTLKTPESVETETEKGVTVKAKEDIEVTTNKKAKLSAQEIELTGGKLTCKGAAKPSGQGPFCAIAVCPFTGAPQTGTEVEGT